MTKLQKARQTVAVNQLRAILKPGDTVTTECAHVSKSGMMRMLRLFVKDETEGLRNITTTVADALGENATDRPGFGYRVLKVTGCGMDMGFATVYSLSRVLFPDGFAVEGRGRNGDTSGHDNDGGYALKQRWL